MRQAFDHDARSIDWRSSISEPWPNQIAIGVGLDQLLGGGGGKAVGA